MATRPGAYSYGFWKKNLNRIVLVRYGHIKFKEDNSCKLPSYQEHMDGMEFVCVVDYASIGMYLMSASGESSPIGPHLRMYNRSELQRYMTAQTLGELKAKQAGLRDSFGNLLEVKNSKYISTYYGWFLRWLTEEEADILVKEHHAKHIVLTTAKRRIDLDA